ncbi:MAG: MBL fold metallo-hydrolase [Gaiellales bacterium]|nr:MBL fold metallo-hydrolase [Gaiellales bacterium]
MKVHEEADGVFRIPVHNPFGVYPTNVYLLVGDRMGLFDVGPGYRRTWEDLSGALSQLAMRPEDVEVVILSHGHADHDGLAHHFSWASILIHQADLLKISDYNGHLDRYEEAVRAVMPTWGVSSEVSETIPGFFTWLRAAGDPAPWAETIADGADLQGLGGSWQVLALPGHTEGLIGLYRARDRLLISSDQLLETTVPNPGFYLVGTTYAGNGMADYERSLHRLAQMSVGRVLPGHGPAFADCSGRVAHFLAQYEERLDQAEAALQGPSTVHQVAERLFPGCDAGNPYHVFITHMEAVGRLSVLVERGRALRLEGLSGGPDRYSRSGR